VHATYSKLFRPFPIASQKYYNDFQMPRLFCCLGYLDCYIHCNSMALVALVSRLPRKRSTAAKKAMLICHLHQHKFSIARPVVFLSLRPIRATYLVIQSLRLLLLLISVIPAQLKAITYMRHIHNAYKRMLALIPNCELALTIHVQTRVKCSQINVNIDN
jgi:hypothetical protein